MALLRAPTIRSVPEMVLVKLSRASIRTRSTASSRATLSAMAHTVNSAVKRRLRRLFQDSETSGSKGTSVLSAVDVQQRHAAVEQRAQGTVVADEY